MSADMKAWADECGTSYASHMDRLYREIGRARVAAPEVPMSAVFGFDAAGTRGSVDVHEGKLRVRMEDGAACLSELAIHAEDGYRVPPAVAWLCLPTGAHEPTLLIGIRDEEAGDGCAVRIFHLDSRRFSTVPGFVFGRPLFLDGMNHGLLLCGTDRFRPSSLRRLTSCSTPWPLLCEDDDPAFFYRLLPCLGGRGALLIGKSTDGVKVNHVDIGTGHVTRVAWPDVAGPVMGLATADADAVFVALATTAGLRVYRMPLGPVGAQPCRLIWQDDAADQYLFALALARESVLLVTGRDAVPRLRAVHRDSGRCVEAACPASALGCELSLRGHEVGDAVVRLWIANPFLPPVPAFWVHEEGLCTLPDTSAHALEQVVYEPLSFQASDGESVGVSIWRRPGLEERPDWSVVGCYGAYGRPPPLMHNAWLACSGAATHVFIHARGGGDRGPGWHEAGRGRRRARSIADVAEALSWLKSSGLPGMARVVLQARSAGCIAMAATLAATPGMAVGAVFEYPFLDLAGALQEKDCLALAEACEWLDEAGADAHLPACCPIRLLKMGAHPPVLVVAGGADWRAPVKQLRRWHEAMGRVDPAGRRLIRIDEGAGHGLPSAHPLMRQLSADIAVFIQALALVQ